MTDVNIDALDDAVASIQKRRFGDPITVRESIFAAEWPAVSAELRALRAAGIKLQGYACHTDDCESVTGAYEGSCSCGYTAAWQAWAQAVNASEYKEAGDVADD
jgi:hypothetical protein